MSEKPTEVETCNECQKPFVRKRRSDAWCPDCEAKWQKENDERIARERTSNDRKKAQMAFQETFPPRFLESDIAHPEFKTTLHKKVMEWEPSEEKPWLGLVGKKGSCKTRIAIMRTHGMIASDNPLRPIFITASEFAEAVQDKFNDETGDARRLIQSCKNAYWLVFDDIGKARNTPAVVAALFALLDHRHSHNLVTIWTSNSTPEEFCEGMPPDTAGPMVRRLKETSTLFSVA